MAGTVVNIAGINNYTLLGSIFTSIFVLSSCAKTPIQKFIESTKYEPFAIPRSDWGAGTIISLKSGREEIIALNPTCINLVPDSTEVALSSYSYTINKDNKLEMSFAKVLNQSLNIEGAFIDKRVKKVNISVVKPKEKILQITLVNRRVKELGQQGVQDCVSDIFSSSNVVITRTLSVDALTYSFLDKDDIKLNIGAELLENIKASDSLKRVYDGKTELNIDKPTYIGYWATKFKATPGLVSSTLEDQQLSAKELKKIKKMNK